MQGARQRLRAVAAQLLRGAARDAPAAAAHQPHALPQGSVPGRAQLWHQQRQPAAGLAAATAQQGGGSAPPALARLWPCQQQLLIAAAAAAARRSTLSSAAPWQLQAAACQHTAGPGSVRSKRAIADNGLYLGAVVLGMIGLSYASVPLYRMFCQATGYGGALGQATGVEDKLRRRAEAPDADVEAKAAARELRVWFSSDVADDMPWRFTPTQEYVKVKPGESTLVFFTAENRSNVPVTGVSTYNVVPAKAALYFNKIQCFCFEEQRLRPGESVDMPVFFYIDPELATDFNCRNIHDITLSYTFYKVDDADADTSSDSAGGGGVKVHTWTSGPIPANIKVPEGLQLPPGVEREAPAAAAAVGGGQAAAAAGGGSMGSS